MAKGGGTNEGNGNYRHAAQDSWGREGPGQQVKDCKGGKCREERWKPVGGGEVQVYRHYAHGRGGRLELGATETIGAESNGDRWGDGSSEAQGGKEDT